MPERSEPAEGWPEDTDHVMTTPGKRLTPEVLERLARARPAPSARDDAPAEPTTDVRGPFDLSDVRRQRG